MTGKDLQGLKIVRGRLWLAEESERDMGTRLCGFGGEWVENSFERLCWGGRRHLIRVFLGGKNQCLLSC